MVVESYSVSFFREIIIEKVFDCQILQDILMVKINKNKFIQLQMLFF